MDILCTGSSQYCGNWMVTSSMTIIAHIPTASNHDKPRREHMGNFLNDEAREHLIEQLTSLGMPQEWRRNLPVA